MVILKDDKKHRILLNMEHFIITTLTLSLNPTPHNYHQTMPTGQTQTNTSRPGALSSASPGRFPGKRETCVTRKHSGAF